MTPQPPVKYSGKCDIRLGVKGIYGMKMSKAEGATNTIRPLTSNVLL